MFAVQGCKKVHFCQSVVFYFSREKYRVSDQTDCIYLWPCQSRVHFCKVTYHLRAGGFWRAAGATSSKFGNIRSKKIQFSSKNIFSHSRFLDLATALHLSCRHFWLQTLTCWGDIFFEGAFLFSKWMLRPNFFKFANFQNHSQIHRARASLEYETFMQDINLILVILCEF